MNSRDQRGFTLLEVLVATVIMGIAVAGLIAGLSQSVKNAVAPDRLRSRRDAGAHENERSAAGRESAVRRHRSRDSSIAINRAESRAAGERLCGPSMCRRMRARAPSILQRVALELWWQPATRNAPDDSARELSPGAHPDSGRPMRRRIREARHHADRDPDRGFAAEPAFGRHAGRDAAGLQHHGQDRCAAGAEPPRGATRGKSSRAKSMASSPSMAILPSEAGEMSPVPFLEAEPQSMRFVTSYSLEDAWRGRPQIAAMQVIPGEKNEGVRLIVNETPYTGPEQAGQHVILDRTGRRRAARSSASRRFVPGPQSFVLADRLAVLPLLLSGTALEAAVSSLAARLGAAARAAARRSGSKWRRSIPETRPICTSAQLPYLLNVNRSSRSLLCRLRTNATGIDPALRRKGLRAADGALAHRGALRRRAGGREQRPRRNRAHRDQCG